MNNSLPKSLTEDAFDQRFMTRQERLFRKKLIKLLVDKHHVKYAKRLAQFDLNFVPLTAEPQFVASISFDLGTIFISEGFLQDESTFEQLDVLMRHELAHNLLMHQVRLMHKMGDEYFPHFSMSSSIHYLLNIIADFEISNTRYSAADKIIARDIKLAGGVIHGLVTEDFRKDWLSLSVEEMFDKLEEELKKITNNIIAKRYTDIDTSDFITNHAFAAFDLYSATSHILGTPSRFIGGTLKDFIDGKEGAKFIEGGNSYATYKDFPEIYQKLIKDINTICTAPDSWYYDNPENIKQVMELISKATPTEVITFKQKDKTGKEDSTISTLIITPEEKWVAIEALKNLAKFEGSAQTTVHVKKSDESHSQTYKDAYNMALELFDLDQITDEELMEILQKFRIRS